MVAAVLAGVLAYDGRLSDQYGQPEKTGAVRADGP
jgi:hypothetical protein